MRSTLAYLRSMDTGTLLFERTLPPPYTLFLSLKLLPVSLWLSVTFHGAAFYLPIRLSFSRFPVNARPLIKRTIRAVTSSVALDTLPG